MEKKQTDFVVMSIDREELEVYGIDTTNVSDETMREIARNMQEWFDDSYADALIECAKQAGLNFKYKQ